MGGKEPVWAQVGDGDLWRHFWQSMIAKGCQSVAMTKVKGHATVEDLQNGVAQPYHKHGNDIADALATSAREDRDDQLSRIIDYFENRQSHYIDFMHSMHFFL